MLADVLLRNLFPDDARDLTDRDPRRGREQDLGAAGDVLAELAGEIDLVAKDVLVADLEDATVADADAQDHVLFVRAASIDSRTGALHGDGAGERACGLLEQDEEAVGLALDEDAIVGLDDREEELLLLVDHLEEVGDAERCDLTREAGEVGQHDRPVIAEQIPDPLIDGGDVGTDLRALLDQTPEAREALDGVVGVGRHRESVLSPASDGAGGTIQTTKAPPLTAPTDTWEYDGSWRRSVLDDAPAQYAHAIAWDPITERVVAVGGGADPGLADVASWDGANWSPPGTDSSLGARGEHILVNTGRYLLLFGGVSGTAVQNDTWRFDGGTWRQEVLPSFQSTQAANDLARRRVVVYSFGITWELDDHAWHRVDTASTSMPHPAASGDVALGYDPVRKETIEFGGTPLEFGADTFAFDGVTWAPRTPGMRPPARAGGRLVFDGRAQQLLLFGGVGASSHLGDTWHWDGTDWEPVIGPGPSPRKGAALGFDAVRSQVVLFGGRDADDQLLDDTWIFDGAWHEVMLTAPPTRREGATLTWNPARQRLVLAGGVTDVLDTWEWNGTGWEGVVAISPTQSVIYHVGFAWPDGRGLGVQGGFTNRLWELTYLVPVPALPDERCAISTADGDGDGLIACNDPDCWSVCTPLCPPATTCPAGGARCGDGMCDPSESCESCTDCQCPPVCGDFRCEADESSACGGDCP